MGVSEDEIKYIRDNFEKKYAEIESGSTSLKAKPNPHFYESLKSLQLEICINIDKISSDAYDPRDLRRLRTDDVFVSTFVRGPSRLDEGVDLVHECFHFRKEYKVNDITEDIFEQWMWEKHALFFHKKTNTGHQILFLRVKLHKKDAAQLLLVKKFFIYWLEMSFKVNPLEKIVTLFDMTDAGLSNLDMEFIRFILTTFKLYYPTLLEKLLIYEMPWIFNAAWKVIKTWLSAEAISKIKFVTKSDVHTYIDKEYLFPHMGGTASWDAVDYHPLQSNDTFDDAEDSTDSKSKKVTFSESTESLTSSLFLAGNTNNNAIHKSSPKSSKQGASVYEGGGGGSFTGRLLTISPADQLTFVADQGGKEIFDVITLTNTLTYPIAFKVKTTAPDKYRVRPSTGVVKPAEAFEVYVYLQPGFITNVEGDKFLVMAMEVAGEGYNTNLWKTAPKDNIMEHRMRCVACSLADFNANVAAATGQVQGLQSRQSPGGQPRQSNVCHPCLKQPAGGRGPTESKTSFRPRPANGPASKAIYSIKEFFVGKDVPEQSNLPPMEQLIESHRQLQRRMGWLIISHIVFFIITLLFFGAFFCLGEDLFTNYLPFPFGYCISSSWKRRC